MVNVHSDNLIGLTLLRPNERMRNSKARLYGKLRTIEVGNVADEADNVDPS